MLRLLTGTCLLLLASSALAGPKKGKQADDDEDSIAVTDDDSDDQDEKPAKKKAKHKDEDASDDSEKPKKKKKASDDDADDKPTKKKAKASDDDADDKPAKKKKAKPSDDEADDKPAKKKKAKAADDEADDKPAKKKKAKADEDDADDKPKKKKAKAADDDADDKPAKKTKKHADDDDTAGDDKPFKKSKKHKDDDEADDKPAKKTKKHKDDDEADDKPAKKTKKHDDEVAAKKDDFDPLATKKETKARKAKSSKVDPDEIEMDDKPPPTDPSSHDDAPPLDSVVAVAPAPAIATPLAIGDRPLTLAKDRLEVHGGFPITVITVPGAMAGTTTSTTSEGFALGVTYGAGAKAEVGADYTLSLNPGRIKGPFAVHGAYRWIEKPKLDVGVAAALAVDFIELTDPMAMTTSTTTSFGLQLGAWARYRITPMVSLFSGLPALPNASPSLSKLAFALPPIAYQLAIGLNNGGAIALELPVGVGVQIKPQIYAFASLNLANIRIANTQNAFLFADFFPIALGGFYSLDKLDVGAVFADDLKQAGDHLSFELAARYLLK